MTGHEETQVDTMSFASAGASIDSFLEEVARIAVPVRRLPLRVAGATVAGRYRLLREIGRGGHGVVWAAADEIAQAEVAVKLLTVTAAERAQRVRSEVASLRRLRGHGVARLLDEGLDDGAWFLVMPLVRGAPFPGRARPTPWTELAATTERLLHVLAEVHAAGVVHRDVKPSNVLVDADGAPWMLDFGLSVVSAFDDGTRAALVVGTPNFLAPEQLVGLYDERTDLYAVGVMLYQALTGELPHRGVDLDALLAAKRRAARPIATLSRTLPPAVASVVDALIAPEPRDRPRSAREALELLQGVRATGANAEAARVVERLRLLVPGDAPVAESALAELFAGSDRLTCVPSDAAQLVMRSTDGDRARVHALLDDWFARGLCRSSSGDPPRIAVERTALDALDSDLRGDARADAVRATAFARRLAERGRLGHASAALHEVLVGLRAEGAKDARIILPVLAAWVEVALAEDTPYALDRVAYELSRTGLDHALANQLESLVRAALATSAWSDRASELAESVAPFEDVGLELRRLGVRVLAARRSSAKRETHVVERVVECARASGDPLLVAAASGWLGRLRYREGRYEEAARLHMENAKGARWRGDRVSAQLLAASAMLEAFQNDEALALALAAREEARACRGVQLSGRAEWIARCALYRNGVDEGVDDELVAAARELGASNVFGLVVTSESAHAHRARDPRRGALAREAYAWWSESGEPIASLLTGALAIAAGEDLGDAARARLRTSAWTSEVPGVGVQASALLVLGGEQAPPAEIRERLASTVPVERWPNRMDVLSVAESLAILRGALGDQGT